MSNILKESMKNNIEMLGKLGWSVRRISRKLGVHRKTVKKYLKPEAKCTIPTAGDSVGNEPKCTIPTTGDSVDSEPKCTIPTAGKPGRRSTCEIYDSFIRCQLKENLSAQRIYQELCSLKGFEGSYEAVKRYVRKLDMASEVPFRRMERLPGEECQVDYGAGAWIVDEQGRRRKTHLFRVALSYSRKGYSEVSYTQSTECFLRAMENAFRVFGSVPETVVIDNLKAGVIKSDVYDPELNPKLREFAEHYGTCIMPTRVYTPRHKGKVERQVDYVQNNAVKGRVFSSLAEQNLFLTEWEQGVADQRIHGTLRRQVRSMFEEEKHRLKKLPPDLFPAFREQKRKVHRDGHVEVEKAYYSVPPEYMRRELWVRFDGRTVKIFNLRMEQITIHARKEPGQFSTRGEHIPKEKISNPERGNEWMLRQAGRIGDDARLWSQAMLQNRGIPGSRVLNGLLSLTRKYPAQDINLGCRRALKAGAFNLSDLKNHVVFAGKQEQIYFEFQTKHALIRDIATYDQNLNTRELFS